MIPLSAVVTTYNNAPTLRECLASVAWADELVVLDSGSSDDSVAIAEQFGARVEVQAFRGYGRQKQDAIDLATNDWILLLDADEALTEEAQQVIRSLLAAAPEAPGYRLPRQEQLFWRWQSRYSRLNDYLRLFDRRRARMSEMPVHAAPQLDGPVGRLDAPFLHYGEPNIHTKVDKINHYSTGLVADKVAKGKRAAPLIMLVYPPFVFLRLYLFKRQFINGWAGLIASLIGAFYAFLKYAKLYEHRRMRAQADSSEPKYWGRSD